MTPSPMYVVDGKEWNKQRKNASRVFSTNFVRNAMHPVFAAKAEELIEMIDKLIATSGKTASTELDMQVH